MHQITPNNQSCGLHRVKLRRNTSMLTKSNIKKFGTFFKDPPVWEPTLTFESAGWPKSKHNWNSLRCHNAFVRTTSWHFECAPSENIIIWHHVLKIATTTFKIPAAALAGVSFESPNEGLSFMTSTEFREPDLKCDTIFIQECTHKHNDCHQMFYVRNSFKLQTQT